MTTTKPRAPRAIPNRCPDAESADRMAAAMERIADSLEDLKPAADVVHDLAGRLDRLCQFVRRRGPWILASMPIVLSAIGAITPELAAGLKSAITALLSAAATG